MFAGMQGGILICLSSLRVFLGRRIEIIALRAIISIRRPDKTLMRSPLLEEVGDGGAGVDLDFGRSPDDVGDASVG